MFFFYFFKLSILIHWNININKWINTIRFTGTNIFFVFECLALCVELTTQRHTPHLNFAFFDLSLYYFLNYDGSCVFLDLTSTRVGWLNNVILDWFTNFINSDTLVSQERSCEITSSVKHSSCFDLRLSSILIISRMYVSTCWISSWVLVG